MKRLAVLAGSNRKFLLGIITWGAVVFSAALIIWGIFGNRTALFAGLLGAFWKITLVLFGGAFLLWFRKRFGGKVPSSGGKIPADSE